MQDIDGYKTVSERRDNDHWLKTPIKCVQIHNVRKTSRLIEELIDGTKLLGDLCHGQQRVQANRMHEKALELMSEMNVAERIEL